MSFLKKKLYFLPPRSRVLIMTSPLSIVLLARKNGAPNFDLEASFRKTHVTLSTPILLTRLILFT